MNADQNTLEIALGLELPLELTGRTQVILAQKGAGKTYTAMRETELLLSEQQQVVALDPTGVWWGLRSPAPHGTGFPVLVMGGQHGDLPLESTAGAIIADFIVESRRSVVLDLSHFESNAQQNRFVTDFAERLYRGKSNDRRTVHLMLDEADSFCLSADTEILSNRGWLTWDEIRDHELVSCFDISTGDYEFQSISRVVVRNHEGTMVHLKTKSMDCLATPDHRVVLKRVQRAQGRYRKYDWTFCSAAEVPTCVGIPMGGAPCGNGVNNLSLESARIIGWLLSDGHLHNPSSQRPSGQNFCLSQSTVSVKKGSRIAQEMSSVLAGISGVSEYELPSKTHRVNAGKATISAPSKSWYFGGTSSEEFRHHLQSECARVPRHILKDGSRPQLESLFQGLLEGDGTSSNGKWVTFYPGKNEGLADDFQEVALRLGISTVKTWIESIKQWHVSVAPLRKQHWLRRRLETNYQGVVWDVTVPTGAFVARRNGKVFVTGNCPQRPQPGEQRMLGAFEAIVRRGRSRGIGITLISQRPAVLNKNVMSQADLLVCLRVTGQHDHKALREWTNMCATAEQAKEFLESLPTLKNGEAWFWSPSWLGIFKRAQVSTRCSYDSSRTPDSTTSTEPVRTVSVDLAKLSEAIKASVERVSADDPKKLRARIAELEKSGGIQAQPNPVEVPILRPGELELFQTVLENLKTEREALQELADRIASAVVIATRTRAIVMPTPQPAKQAAPPMKSSPVPSGSSANLGKAERAILSVLAQYHPDPVDKARLACIAGYSANGGGFNNPLSKLRTGGLIRGGDPIELTPVGRAAIGDVAPLPTGKALLDYWIARLGKAEGLILAALAEAGGRLDKESLAAATGYAASGGGFNNPLSHLRTLQLISGTGGAPLKLADVLL